MAEHDMKKSNEELVNLDEVEIEKIKMSLNKLTNDRVFQ